MQRWQRWPRRSRLLLPLRLSPMGPLPPIQLKQSRTWQVKQQVILSDRLFTFLLSTMFFTLENCAADDVRKGACIW